MKKFCIRAFIIFAAYFFYTENAIAGPFTHTKRSVKNMTETIVTIEGQVGETFDVRYTDATGRPKTKRVTTDLTGTGEVTVQPAKGTRVTIINKSQPVPNQTFIASLFEPPDKVVSDYVINTGSTIELASAWEAPHSMRDA